MPLNENVETLEGIDEAYHDLYVENAEGTFDINITGLKTALNKERATNKKLSKKLNVTLTPDPDAQELQNQLKEATSTIKNMKVGSKVKSAALKAGIDPDYVDDVISLTKGNFGLDDAGNVVMVDAEGDPTGQTLDRYFDAEFKKSKPRFYNSSGRQGSGIQPNINGDGPLSYKGKLQKAIAAKDTLEVIRLKNKKLK